MELFPTEDHLPSSINWITGTLVNVALAVTAAGVFEMAKRVFRISPKTVAGTFNAYQSMLGVLDVIILKNDANKKLTTDKAI
jgi:hypothetical protein